MKSNATDTDIFCYDSGECKLGLHTFFEHISQSKSLSSRIKILHVMDRFGNRISWLLREQYENMVMLIMILSRKICNKHITLFIGCARKWTFSSPLTYRI